MKSLYRRYRPKSLSEVVGQAQVTEPLSNALKEGRVSHAYLFIGPRGTGKTSVARILAHEVNGFPYELEDDYVDIIEIDGASNRGIDNIRELREKVAIAPTRGKYKVYIIDEVHMLTKEAFNALLKTLEEPPEHVIFIMATTDAYKVPVTITSRAQVYNFKLAEPAVMIRHLKSICEREGIKIEDAALEIIVKRGGGSYRDSLSLLDQISTLSQDLITKDLVVKAMGLASDEKIEKLLSSYVSGDLSLIAEDLKSLLSDGIEAKTVAEELMNFIIEKPRAEYLDLLAKLPEVKTPYAEARLLAALYPVRKAAGPIYSRSGDSGRVLSERLFSGPTISPSTSYAGRPGEPSPSETNLSAPSGIYVSERANRPLSRRKDVSATRPVEITPQERKAEYENSQFDWDEFLAKVQSLNEAIYLQLKNVGHEAGENNLEIYPAKKIAKNILSRDNNKKILIEAAGGMRVTIHEVGEDPNARKDSLISAISDIMGGEVQNDAGGNPF